MRIDDAVGSQGVTALLEDKDSPAGVLFVHAGRLDTQSPLYVIDRLPSAAELELVGVADQPDEMAADIVRMHRLASLDGEDVTGISPGRTPRQPLGQLLPTVRPQHPHCRGFERHEPVAIGLRSGDLRFPPNLNDLLADVHDRGVEVEVGPPQAGNLTHRLDMPGKAVVSLSTGMEDPEKVTVAFLVAVGAAEAGRPTLMFQAKEAVRLALDGVAAGVACEGCPPLHGLLTRYEKAGGRYMVCPVWFNAKQLDKGDLVPNAELAGSVQLWEWIGDEPATTFSY